MQFKLAASLGCVVVLSLTALSARAQMAVTTFGATDAVSCYENAADEFSRDTKPCDAALDGDVSRDDEKKTLVNRGVIHNRNGDLQAALDDFNAALAIDGALAEGFLNRGNSYLLAGRPDEALADYDEAVALGVNRPWAAWYNIGLAHEAKKDPAKAREAYEMAIEINPAFTAAQMKLAEADEG